MARQRNETLLQGTPDEIVAHLARLSSQDAEIEKELRRWNRYQGGAWTGCALSGCVTFFLFSTGIFWLLTAPLVVACLVAGILTGRKASELKHRDLDNHKLDLVARILDVLREDMSGKSASEIVVRHGDLFQWGTKVSQQKVGGGLGFGVTQSAFEDEWLQFHTRLADGSALRIGVGTDGKRKSKPKRKYTKHSDRMSDVLHIAVRTSPEVYPDLSRLQSAVDPATLRTRAGLVVKRFAVVPPVVRVSLETLPYRSVQGRYGRSDAGHENRISADDVLQALAFVYGGLGACRAPAAGAVAKPTGAPGETASPAAPAPSPEGE